MWKLILMLTAVLIGSLSSMSSSQAERGIGSRQPAVAPVTTDLESPVDLTYAPGGPAGALFVLEQVGRVRVLRDGELLKKPFLDITDRVGSSSNEQGLLGIAFAPDFARSRRFFVNYTDKKGDTVVAGFKAVDDWAADARSEWRVLSIDQPYQNHNGGQLRFGPDGMLYIGMGDGGSGGDPQNYAQNVRSLLGKMLRIDVSQSTAAKPYSVPKDNPKFGPGSLPEIWAVGLRNPWRFSFDRKTGEMWIADVGQGEYEEVSVQPAGRGGLNYGWKLREGLHEFEGGARAPQFTDPIHEYAHGDDGCSVTGGFVYRGRQAPDLVGAYVFGDFCSGRIWTLQRDGKSVKRTLLHETTMKITSFGEDAAGELYVLDRAGGVYRLTGK